MAKVISYSPHESWTKSIVSAFVVLNASPFFFSSAAFRSENSITVLIFVILKMTTTTAASLYCFNVVFSLHYLFIRLSLM